MKYKAAIARRDTLENQVKDNKVEFQSKAKILIEKTENDDKLINLLKQEIRKLEQQKGVKSNLNNASASVNEVIKLQTDIAKMNTKVKYQEIQLDEKEKKIKQLMTNCIGAPDELAEEKELMLTELQEKIDKLEKENYTLKIA